MPEQQTLFPCVTHTHCPLCDGYIVDKRTLVGPALLNGQPIVFKCEKCGVEFEGRDWGRTLQRVTF